MEIPIIVTETPETAAAAAPPKVDLNTADATTLITLPGIGPALAERILAYRETRGPFLAPEELLAVPGIGAKVYAGLAERLTLSLPVPEAATDADSAAVAPPFVDEAPPPAEAPALPENPPAGPLPLVDEEPALPAPPPAPRPEPAPAPASQPEPAPLPAPQPEPAPRPEPAPQAPPAPPAAPAPRAEKRSGWGWLGWVSAVFVGSILGMIFSLLVLTGINGTLNTTYHPAIMDLQNQAADLAARQETLQGEVSGLRQRLDRLEGLTTRMERTEATVKALDEDVSALREEITALGAATDVLTEQIATVEARTVKAETFFQRLQALLTELFGDANAPSPAPQAPVEQEAQP